MFSFIIYSCTPHNILNEGIFTKEKNKTGYKKNEQIETIENINKTDESNQNKIDQVRILSEIEIILPSKDNKNITQDFINSLELSVYKKSIKNISLNINIYSDKKSLHNIIKKRIQKGKIFIGPLTSNYTKELSDYFS